MRAKVIFTDSWHVSPTIETDDDELEDRIIRAISSEAPGDAATRFALISGAARRPVTLLNTPEGRTFGGTLSMIQSESFWPADGNQAGVFLAYLNNLEIHYWGGRGFRDSEPFTPGIVQILELESEETE